MEWTIVHFIDEDMVEAVPKVWLYDKLCYWPPYTSKRLNHAITMCEKPVFATWNLFKIRQLGNGRTYDNLPKAKAKASKAEDTSDLASDHDGKRIRKKKKNLYSSTDETQSAFSTESSSDNEVVAPIKFPAIPNHTEIKANINKNVEPSTSKSNVIETSTCTDSEPLISNKQSIITKDIENIIEPNKSNNIKKKLLPESTISKTVHCNERDTTSNNDQNDNRDIEFKKQILRQLQIINYKQTQMWEDIQTIMSKIVMQADDKILTKNDKESIFNKFTFPLKSISELDAVEEFLNDENNYGLLVQELTKIGGSTYKHAIKRIMFKLFSNEVAEGYSWIGFKGKNKFCLLRISAAIIMAVQKTHSTSTLCDIEAVIKAWLVKAKFRNTKKTT